MFPIQFKLLNASILLFMACFHGYSAPFWVDPRDIEGYVAAMSPIDLCSGMGHTEGMCDSLPGFRVVILDATAEWSDSSDTTNTGGIYGTGSFDTLLLDMEADPNLSEYMGERIIIYGYSLFMDEFSENPTFDSVAIVEETRVRYQVLRMSKGTERDEPMSGFFTINGCAVREPVPRAILIQRN
jgi:hypothetical protein